MLFLISINRFNFLGARPNRTKFVYDSGNRLDTITHRHVTSESSSTLLNDYDLAYDNASRLTAVTSNTDGNSALTYDKTNQVTAADHASGRTDESYSFDANGNRTNSGYSTGTNNRTTTDGTYNYEYDKEGNRTKRTLISSGAYEVYTWDQRNRLTKVEFKSSGGSVTKWVEYTYDMFNRLLRRKLDADGSGGGAATNTFYVGYDGISPTLEFDNTTKDDVSHRYVWGAMADQLFADEQVSVTSSDGNTLWALADHLGTIRDIADYDSGSSTFSITNHRVYDTFGKLESETGSSVDLIFGYTGKQFDEDTKMNNYLNRWYDSRIGKWLSEDPLGFSAGDANLSRYVGNTSSMMIDPLGLAGGFGGDGSATSTSESALLGALSQDDGPTGSGTTPSGTFVQDGLSGGDVLTIRKKTNPGLANPDPNQDGESVLRTNWNFDRPPTPSGEVAASDSAYLMREHLNPGVTPIPPEIPVNEQILFVASFVPIGKGAQVGSKVFRGLWTGIAASKAARATIKIVDKLLDGATLVEKGKTIRYAKPGGFRQAIKDFSAAVGKNPTKPHGGGITSSILPDGSTIAIRPATPRQKPTIQITPLEGKQIKIRYE